MKRPSLLFLIIICVGVCVGCSKNRPCEPVLSSISIIDRNGMTETMSAKDRLKQYENVDFLGCQPYQKVLRIYERDEEGNIEAFVSSYHPNGQVKQYLEVSNGRAFGKYQEWTQEGVLKIDANVIGGMPDLNTSAEQSWLFDGANSVWDDDGILIAEFHYDKGELEGVSYNYHANGKIWKRIPYHKNEVNGTVEIFLEDGTLMQTYEFANGVKNGCSIRYWSPEFVASTEDYTQGLLKTAQYFDNEGELVAEISDGTGFRAVFGKDYVCELHEFRNGSPDGNVQILSRNGNLLRTYHVKDEVKHGEEIEYYETLADTCVPPKQKFSVNWYEGKIQGIVKTWYESGAMECQKEMSNNTKSGLLTAWYRDGSLMMIEEYDHDKLVKGEYFKTGDKFSVSQVSSGRGIATLFDAEGHFVRKVNYNNGKPADL